MKNMTGKITVLAVVSLFAPASLVVAADQMLVYQASSGTVATRELTSDGSGGLMIDASTNDGLGTWGGVGWDVFAGDVDGDGLDEMLAYQASSGTIATRELTSDGSGGLMIDASSNDGLGTWGGVGWAAMVGDVDGDNSGEVVVYQASSGSFFSRELIPDGSGGLIMDISSQDSLGAWGGVGWAAFLADIDGDGSDEVLVYQASSGTIATRELTSDGSGGLMIDASTNDGLGTWGGVGWDIFAGDIDGDGLDEILAYQASSGSFFSRELISDGFGGLVLDASSQDSLGTWGGVGWVAFTGNLVPEPATLGLMGLGSLMMLRRQCKGA